MRYLIEYFKNARKFIGRKIYLLLFLVLITGIIESIGITLFLPILQDGFGSDKLSRILKFGFDSFHINYSFTLTLIIILVFFVVRSIFLISYNWYFGKVLANLTAGLRQKIVNKIFAVDYLYLLKKEIGYLNNVIVREIARVVDAFKNFTDILRNVLYSVIYMILALLLNFKAALIVMSVGPIVIFLMKNMNIRISNVSRKYSLSYGRLNSMIIQCLSKFKYLKATSSYVTMDKIVAKENKNLGNLQFRLLFLQYVSRDIFEPIIVMVTVGLLFYYVVILKRNVSEVIFLIFIFMQVAREFLNLQGEYRKFLASVGSIETFNNFLQELDENREKLNPDGACPDFDRDIKLRNVTVVFPNGKKALENININIRAKSSVAFVGPSGSGKSTIANMVTGIIKPTAGEILFGDTRYDMLNLSALRKNIGYVTQEDVIFNASIKENISLWDEGMDEEKLKNAIGLAHISHFVNDLPSKQNTLLGDNGLDISGGQRQRVTIARELYKNAKLLILDEATSSLDSKSEKHIYENLKEFKGKKTMVVIAHRLSTIKNADYVYVFEEGRVVEEGTYEDLHQRSGEFTKMVEAQKLT